MSLSVPKEVDYSNRPNSLPPNTINTDVVVAPTNGSSFSTDGDIIQFQLPARGFLVPSTMYLRYKNTTTCSANKVVLGTPFYTPFSRLQVSIGASVVESIEGYNQLANILVNTKMDYAEKLGLAKSFGLIDDTTTPTFANINGRTILTANSPESYDVAGALGCILSNADHLVPLGAMPSVQIQLTLDAKANMFDGGVTDLTSQVLSNLELCFQSVEFGAEIDPMILSMTDAEGNILIKSQSYTSSAQALAPTTGQIELIYNQRLSSIKSILANFNGAGNNVGGLFDSVDVTGGEGDYQFLIASKPYPVRPMSVAQNMGGVYEELSNCWSMSHSLYSSKLAITPKEFSYKDNEVTTGLIPGKFIVAQNTEKLSSSAMLTGVSSQLSPISLRINLGATAPTNTHNVTLICNYDAILVINPLARQVMVRQ